MQQGIPDDAMAFFAELEVNNDRAWWSDNLDRWRASVREPVQALCDALSDEFGQPTLFRPHRDVRFAADKSPYKTHQGAVVRTSPGVGLYLQVSADGLLTGTGWWRPEPGQLDAYRAAVLDDDSGEALARITARLAADGVTVRGDLLKTAPRGVDPAHPRIGLLRHRTLLVSLDHGEPVWLGTAEVVERVAQDWLRYGAVNDWLARHLAG